MKEGWQMKKLREVCELVNGRAYSKPELLAAGKYRVLRVGNFFTNDHWYHSDMELEEKKYCDTGDLLYAWSASFGPRMWTGGKVIYHYHIWKVVHDRSQIDQKFLFYFFQWDTDKIKEDQGTGTTMMHVSMGSMNERNIHLPPLAEQQRIVGLLDEAFEGLATAKATAEKNLQNARALFESQLQSVFTQRGPGWKTTTLGAEIDLLAGFAFKSAQYTNDDSDIRLLRGDNIIQGCLRWDDVKRWPADGTGDYDRYQLEEGDVVLAMDRPWVKAGLKHATISAEDLPCLLVQRTARLRGGANLNNRFLKLLIGSSSFTSHILGVQTGIGVPHISGQQIKDFEFARPPLADQRRIADNLESLHQETQRLARLYERKLAALDALKKSLHQAFSGEL